MRSTVPRMLYSPERSSLAGTAPAGSVLSRIILSKIIFFRRILPAGARHSGNRHTFYRVKEENGSSMRRGHRSISKLSAFFLRALPLLLLCCLAALGSRTAHAQSAKTWYQRGQAAESHKDYDTALQDYQHAVNLKPNDLRYKESFARMRFQAAAAHVDRGRVLIQSGDLNGALAQFQRALEIDPSYEAAQQEIDQLQKQISASPPSGPPAPTEQASRQNETLASIGGWLNAPDRIVLGLELKVNHLRPARDGWLTGTGVPIHLGRTTQLWEMRITDEAGRPKQVRFKVDAGAISDEYTLDYVWSRNEVTWTLVQAKMVKGMDGAIAAKRVTYDFARLMEGATELKTSEFADAIINNM